MEIYLLIGQSNMAGRGTVEVRDRSVHPRVWALSEQLNWVPAQEPLHFDKPEIVGVGPGFHFGQIIAEAKPETQTGLVPCAVGGTSLDEWKPDGHLFNEAVCRCKVAMRDGQLAGILWHQGENDIDSKQQADYPAKLEQFIGALRVALGEPNVTFVLGELGHFLEKADTINRLLPQIIVRVPNTYCVLADGLTHGGDEVHFDAQSARKLGQRYATVFLNYGRQKSNGISDNR